VSLSICGFSPIIIILSLSSFDTNKACSHNLQHYTKGSRIRNTSFSAKTTHMQPLAPTRHTLITSTSPYGIKL
ncbi:MAG: hypothetical protein LBF12_03180, partial [Christensenellaceae bacterium]|nr:hypothetical protein [Christensenellaceae bacterium]